MNKNKRNKRKKNFQLYYKKPVTDFDYLPDSSLGFKHMFIAIIIKEFASGPTDKSNPLGQQFIDA